MAGGKGTKEIATRYPCVSSLEADGKHEGRVSNLVPTSGSLVPRRLKAGL